MRSYYDNDNHKKREKSVAYDYFLKCLYKQRFIIPRFIVCNNTKQPNYLK